MSSGDPCPAGLLCNEVTNTCGECLTAADCDDGIACTDNLCVAGGCIFALNNINCTDDGLFCNGPEVCDVALGCVSAGDPCSAGQLCNEVTNTCGECLVDTDCDNGLFCDGTETCLGGACQPGTDPCVGQLCDEVINTCVECLADADCNDGNDCTQNLCNAGVCTFPNVTDGSVCGTAPAGDCDLQDTCLAGACVDNVRAVGTECRAGAGECDVAEVCDGITHDCPLDGFVVDGTACTDEGNECTDDVCAAGVCAHPPRIDGIVCGGAPVGACDLQDLCVAGSCVDNVRSAGTICRSAASECDVAEVCDGLVGNCPLDDFQSAGVSCTDDLVECTNDFCDGLGACAHPPVTDGTLCGAPPVGVCDAADTCIAGVCTDQVQPVSTVCRTAQGECDVDDSCDGVNKDCPPDQFQPPGVACADEGNECTSDACDGNGACAHTPLVDGTPCLDEGNECTDDVCAAGACAHPARSAGTPCGNPADTECDNPDTCDGGGTCLSNAEPVGFVCGDPTDTECENPDTCNGSGACLSNAEPFGTPCGNPANSQCDQADTCDGNGTCQDNILPAGAACGDPTDTFCDDPDTCDGAGTCQANLFPCPPGLVCFNSQNGAACVECTQDSDCDDGVFCNGAEVCIALSCGLAVDPCDDGNVCTDDTCIESIQACTHVPDDTIDPDDGIFCNGVDTCVNGVLVIAPPEDCNDNSVCTTEFCDPVLDACVFTNVGGNCDDNEPCTENDVCVAGVCVGETVGGNGSGEVDLGWAPTAPSVPNGDVLQIGLIISSADQTPATASMIDVIMQWDPTKLRLLGKVDNGPYTWQLSTFPNDSGQDGLNNSFDDGNALYRAWSLPTNPVTIPMSGLLMTTMEFQTLEPVPSTVLEIPLCLGATPTVTVIDGGVLGILTGILGSATIQIADCGTSADCDDGLFCNGVELCDLGVCVPGSDPCDDGNLCTDDTCNEAADVCINTALTGDFDQDGLFCNGTDRCENGVFVPGTPPICNDGNLCTDDSCDESVNGCVSVPNTVPCDDGNVCTINDACAGGACTGDVNPDCTACNFDIDCDDGIQCTDDTCHPAGFCENIPNNENCTDDGLFCNGQEVCNPPIGDPITGCTSTGPPCPNCDEVNGCPCDTPLVEVMGNRYLRLTPQPADSNVVTALVVTSCAGANPQYVGPLPGETGLIGFDQDGDGIPESTVGALVAAPANALWLTPAQWGGSVFVTGLFITPDTLLDVQADCGDPLNPNLTAPVSVMTSVYGDVDGDGSASLGDALLIVLGFQNVFTDSTRALTDLAPCLPNQSINIGDVFFAVLAFQGDPPFLFTCEESVCVP
ncbi:MAG: hypothetical protein ACE5EX_04800 [Phycisphaerae bacterium]